MVKEPKYHNSWKGKVLKAIIIDGIMTWRGIQKATKLKELDLNTALSELYDLKLILKFEQTYRVHNSQIINEYISYYSEKTPSFPSKTKRIVKDQKHADLVNYVVKTQLFKGTQSQTASEYMVYDDKSVKYIDVVRWHFTEIVPYIALFEIKPKIDDFGSTIRQIKYYQSLLSRSSEPNFGDYPKKEIFTYLVLTADQHNFQAFHRYRDTFKTTGLDFLMFVKLATNENKVIPVKSFKNSQLDPLYNWIIA